MGSQLCTIMTLMCCSAGITFRTTVLVELQGTATKNCIPSRLLLFHSRAIHAKSGRGTGAMPAAPAAVQLPRERRQANLTLDV
ncbi:hypothetical protein BC834DRAFT_893632 [Gloeopeniophorella convolvens]|nr:hypothetical protein BC834DRAFT_893632 [Gloeopeniophorella convolvens]